MAEAPIRHRGPDLEHSVSVAGRPVRPPAFVHACVDQLVDGDDAAITKTSFAVCPYGCVSALTTPLGTTLVSCPASSSPLQTPVLFHRTPAQSCMAGSGLSERRAAL